MSTRFTNENHSLARMLTCQAALLANAKNNMDSQQLMLNTKDEHSTELVYKDNVLNKQIFDSKFKLSTQEIYFTTFSKFNERIAEQKDT